MMTRGHSCATTAPQYSLVTDIASPRPQRLHVAGWVTGYLSLPGRDAGPGFDNGQICNWEAGSFLPLGLKHWMGSILEWREPSSLPFWKSPYLWGSPWKQCSQCGYRFSGIPISRPSQPSGWFYAWPFCGLSIWTNAFFWALFKVWFLSLQSGIMSIICATRLLERHSSLGE